jgi:TolA-binding protein
MTELFEWLKGLDYTAIYSMLGLFVTTWGGTVVALVIGLLKQRTKNFNYKQALDKLQITLNQQQTEKIDQLRGDIVTLLTDVQKNIIVNNDKANEKRMEVINTVAKEAEESLKELKELTADEALKGLN